MTSMNIMSIVGEANPLPDPQTLVGSNEADELALRRPESIIQWHAAENGYTGNGYHIRLAEPFGWDVTLDGNPYAEHQSLKAAFSDVERHYRRSLELRNLKIWGVVLAVTVLAAFGIVALPGGEGNILLALPVFVGVSGLIRVFAIVLGDINDPYKRRLPWERQPWWKRVFSR